MSSDRYRSLLAQIRSILKLKMSAADLAKKLQDHARISEKQAWDLIREAIEEGEVELDRNMNLHLVAQG